MQVKASQHKLLQMRHKSTQVKTCDDLHSRLIMPLVWNNIARVLDESYSVYKNRAESNNNALSSNILKILNWTKLEMSSKTVQNI